MEPLVQYSQRDPLYDTNKLILGTETHNDLKHDDLITDNNHLSENIYDHNYAQHHSSPVYYQQEPEPIIEIIIKDANVTFPPVPVPTAPPKKKEPVQVFYVKYKKNPNGSGKDSIIYDTPIPAISPHVHDEHEQEHHQIDKPQEYVTIPPPPSTTLRTIIRPESETFFGTQGIHVTFGSEKKHEKHEPEGIVESAPQPAVVFPRPESPSFPPQQYTEQSNARVAFPPNFNPANNFNTPPSGSRSFPSFNKQFSNNQFKFNYANFQGPTNNFKSEQTRSFPTHFNVRPPPFSQGPPSAQQRQPFNNQRPPFNNGPAFNHGPPSFNNQGPSFNNQGPPFNFNNQPFPQQPNRVPVSQITFTQKPPTHFPIPQQPIQHPNHQYFNQKPIQNDQRSPAQQSHLNFQQHVNQQINTKPVTSQPLPLSQPQKPHLPHNHPLPHEQQFQTFNQEASQQQAPQHQPLIQHPSSQLNNHQNNQPQINRPLNHQNQYQQTSTQQNFNVQTLNQGEQLQHQSNQYNFVSQNQQYNQQQYQQQNYQQQAQGILPPGGELVKSVPKYEQHLSIPVVNNQPVGQPQEIHVQNNLPQALPLVQEQRNNQPISFNFNAGLQNLQQVHHSPPQNYQQLLSQPPQHEQFKPQKEEQPQVQTQRPLTSEEYQQYLQQQYLNSAAQGPQSTTQRITTQQAQPQVSNNQNQYYFQVTKTQQHQQQQQQTQQLQQQQLQQQQVQQQQLQQQPQQGHYIKEQYTTQRNIPPLFQTTLRNNANTQKIIYTPTTSKATTPTVTTTTAAPENKNSLPPNIELPDEVPEELRQQLISSGILNNAQISILDYDKVGDIPIEALPPDQLANFYGAGGAQQIAASEQKLAVVDTKGKPVKKEKQSLKEKQNVEMKVVHFNPDTPQGQAVHDSYVKEDATQVDPVVINDNKYNRYLPVKVNGAQFPIPDVPELNNRKVASVVVLAPVNYEFHQSKNERNTRDIEGDIKQVQFLTGSPLKELIKTPSAENYRRWLKKENETVSDKQSVVLLVTE